MNDVKFLSFQKPVSQLDFDGHNHVVMVGIGEIHIVYQGRVMCGATKELLKKKYEAKSEKESVSNPGKNVCNKCQESYKANGQLAWSKWVGGINISIGSSK